MLEINKQNNAEDDLINIWLYSLEQWDESTDPACLTPFALALSDDATGYRMEIVQSRVDSGRLLEVGPGDGYFAEAAMKAAEAAVLLENLDEGVAVQIVSRMKSKKAGAILGRMKTKVAKRISEKIAGKKVDSAKTAKTK